MPNPRHVLGERAEAVAAEWLATHGWTILARRWRCPEGELDLVARDPAGVIVAVEVKVRRTGRAGIPAESVDRRRLIRLRVALGQFAGGFRAPLSNGIRVDLVSLLKRDDGGWLLSHHRGIDAW